MADDILSSLLPQTRDVPCGGDKVLTVRGVPIRRAAELLSQHPLLLSYFSGASLDVPALLLGAPDAAVAVMAAGLGKLGDKETADQLDVLPMGLQLDIIGAVIDLTTAGDSFVPFVSFLRARSESASAAGPDPSPPETSSENSQPQPTSSSEPATSSTPSST